MRGRKEGMVSSGKEREFRMLSSAELRFSDVKLSAYGTVTDDDDDVTDEK